MRLILLPLALSLTACVEPDRPTGREDFADYCAACHGLSGTGDGEGAAALARAPADLTQLARRNDGVFPGTAVMAKIWGYTGGRDNTTPMPQFGALLQGDLVPYDGGDGIATPTPIRLVQLAEYLESLQDRTAP